MRSDFYHALDVPSSRRAFQENGLAVLRGFLCHDVLCQLRDRIGALSQRGMRKDFSMPQTNLSPRNMTVIGGAVMNAEPDVMRLYRSPSLRADLSEIVGNRISDCPELIENVIATVLSQPGDTHGWHYDDYPIALIMCLEAPGSDAGGMVELDRESHIESVQLHPGDAYLMRTDKVRHRVAPIVKQTKRMILNFTYSFNGLDVTPNGSAPLLCS